MLERLCPLIGSFLTKVCDLIISRWKRLLTFTGFTPRPGWHYDLDRSLEDIEEVAAKPSIIIHSHDVHSFLSATFVFQHAEGKVGELCMSQLTIFSDAHGASPPVVLSGFKIEVEGSMKSISIRHKAVVGDAERKPAFLHTKPTLAETTIAHKEDEMNILAGEDDLTIIPGQTRVFEFSSLLREAGEASAIAATISRTSQLYDFNYVQTFESAIQPDVWWGEKASKRKIIRENASAITIMPKPPKLELRVVRQQEQNYTNEISTVLLEITNGEDVDSIVSVEVRLVGDSLPEPTLKLMTPPENEIEDGSAPPGFTVGKIASAASSSIEIQVPPFDIPLIYLLTVKASYYLVSDMETSIYKTMSIELPVINPFEANYDFAPRLHPDPWPSIFTHDETEDTEVDLTDRKAHGLSQKWCLTSRYFSFATKDLIVEDRDVKIIGTNGNIKCSSNKLSPIPEGGIRVAPKSLDEAEFDITTQKLSLDDRGTATVDVSLAINWRRDTTSSPLNTTVLAVPRLLVSSSEPRVLASVSYSPPTPSSPSPSLINLDVTIENPSNHFLTFGLSMEPSEKFAFSGSKSMNLQLVPLSRRTVRFRILPYARGEWVGPVRCVIRDRYFQKVLKISAGEGMKVDKDGLLVWSPPEEDEDEETS